MRTRSAYGAEVANRARRVLADVFAALGGRAEYAVLVGGGVPGLLPAGVLANAPGHAGTTDADILLDPEGFGPDEYETLAERLLERGYRYRKDRDGNDLKFSFEVEVAGATVVVDFLGPPDAERRGFRVPIQPGLHAHEVVAAHVVSWFTIEVTIEEELLQGGRLPIRVAVTVFEEVGGEEVDRLAAQAYAVVQGFLRRWDEED